MWLPPPITTTQQLLTYFCTMAHAPRYIQSDGYRNSDNPQMAYHHSFTGTISIFDKVPKHPQLHPSQSPNSKSGEMPSANIPCCRNSTLPMYKQIVGGQAAMIPTVVQEFQVTHVHKWIKIQYKNAVYMYVHGRKYNVYILKLRMPSHI